MDECDCFKEDLISRGSAFEDFRDENMSACKYSDNEQSKFIAIDDNNFHEV